MRTGLCPIIKSLPLCLCVAAVGCDEEFDPGEGRDAFEDATDARGDDEEDLEFRAFTAGRHLVRNQANGRCLNVPWGSSTTSTVNLHSPCHYGPSQQFAIESVSGGRHRLRNVASGECVMYSGHVHGSGVWSAIQDYCFAYTSAFDVTVISNTADGAIVELKSSNLHHGINDWCLQKRPNSSSGVEFRVCDGGTDQQWRVTNLDLNTCEDACGGKSDGACWCDDLCTGYGDCCYDYDDWCVDDDDDGGGSACPSGQVCCEPLPGGDCNICAPSFGQCP